MIVPVKQVVSLGCTTSFSCISSEPVVWKFKEDKVPHRFIENAIPERSKTTTKKLMIHNAQEKNIGVYSCESPYGDYVIHSGRAHLELAG